VVVSLLLVLLAGCGDGTSIVERTPEGTAVVLEAPVALAATDGGFLVAEKGGRIVAVGASGDGASVKGEVATVPVGADSVGVRGLAVDDDAVFVSWVGDDGIFRVGAVEDGEVSAFWDGPVGTSPTLAGRIGVLGDGHVLVGVGDLDDPGAVADPATPNGKFLILDPTAGPDQAPEVLSGGWVSPYAFDVGPDDEVWVVDRGRDGPDRFARADVDGQPTQVAPLVGQNLPSGLGRDDTDFLLCQEGPRRLEHFRLTEEGMIRPIREVLARDCLADTEIIHDGVVVYAAEDRVVVLAADD